MTQTCQVCLAQSAMPGVIAEGEWHTSQPQQSSTELQATQSVAPHFGDEGYVSSSLTSSICRHKVHAACVLAALRGCPLQIFLLCAPRGSCHIFGKAARC